MTEFCWIKQKINVTRKVSMKELCWLETIKDLKLQMLKIWSENNWLIVTKLLNILSPEDKLFQDLEMNALLLTANNGTLTTVIKNGEIKSWTTLKLNLNATVKLSIMISFIPSTGLKNGAAPDHLVWEQNFHSINNIWSNLSLTQLFILLSTQLLICSKETLMVLNSVFWVSDMKILPQTSGTMFFWENNTLLKRYLNSNWTNWDNHSFTGILWIWDVLPRILSKTILLWLFTIT